MIYITTATTYSLPPCGGLRFEFNQATTGTVTIADSQGTKAIVASSNTTAKVYYGFVGAITITNASAENITVSVLNRTD